MNRYPTYLKCALWVIGRVEKHESAEKDTGDDQYGAARPELMISVHGVPPESFKLWNLWQIDIKARFYKIKRVDSLWNFFECHEHEIWAFGICA